MKMVKTPGADLEKKRLKFFKIGIIVSCSLALLAFRWTTYDLESEHKSTVPDVTEESLIIEQTEFSFRKPLHQTVSKKKIITTSVFEIVEEIPEEGKKQVELITLEEILKGIGDGTSGEEGIKDPEIPSRGEKGWERAERTPYFDECASPGNREEESLCTYAKIRNFVQSHTRYPERCREQGISGTVWVSFVIDKTGNVSSVEVIKSPHTELSDAALKSVGQLPKMNPGTQRLNPVDVRLEIPVKFLLRR